MTRQGGKAAEFAGSESVSWVAGLDSGGCLRGHLLAADVFEPHEPDPDRAFPSSARDWIPDGHLAGFISDMLDQLDLSLVPAKHERRGTARGHQRDEAQALQSGGPGTNRGRRPPASEDAVDQELEHERYLGLPELIAIGVGGMIGGGIFSVLGMAVGIAGHAAPLAFAIGSVVALAAGYSYIKLALGFRSDGASFTYLERAFPAHPNVAGIAGWTVIVGYIGTLALYAFTFGAYGSHLLGGQESGVLRMSLSAGVLLFFMVVNLVGARVTGRAEDLIVYTKIILLGIFVAAGLGTMSADNLTPIFDEGVASPFVAGALIFVAFEGFQLITNGVTETRDADRNIPRGIYWSIVITSLIYVGVAFVALGNMDSRSLIAAEEYALAVAAGPSLGDAGALLVDVAALLATSSAINATLFGASRMLAEMAAEERVPAAFSHRTRVRVPWMAVVTITVLGAAFTVLGSLETIATFSSLTFLVVSMGVSAANLRLRAKTESKAGIILLGMALMSVTIVLLVIHLGRTQLWTLAVVAGLFAVIAVAEIAFFERSHERSQV